MVVEHILKENQPPKTKIHKQFGFAVRRPTLQNCRYPNSFIQEFQKNISPIFIYFLYNLNIVESGIKHHKPKHKPFPIFRYFFFQRLK